MNDGRSTPLYPNINVPAAAWEAPGPVVPLQPPKPNLAAGLAMLPPPLPPPGYTPNHSIYQAERDRVARLVSAGTRMANVSGRVQFAAETITLRVSVMYENGKRSRSATATISPTVCPIPYVLL